MSKPKPISPYVRLLEQWRESVRKMFVANARKKAIVQLPVDAYMKGAIQSAETLGYVCVATIEGNALVIYAREAVKGSDLHWNVRSEWMTKEAL